MALTVSTTSPSGPDIDPRTNFVYVVSGAGTFYHARTKYSGGVVDTYGYIGGRDPDTYVFNPSVDLDPNTGYSVVIEISQDSDSPPAAESWISGDGVNFTTGPLPPGDASNPSPADEENDVDVNLASLSWDAAPYATSYAVEIKIDGSFVEVGTTGGTEISLSSFIPLDVITSYDWKVNAINSTDNNWSSLWEFTTGDGRPNKPTNPTPEDIATSVKLGLTTLSWEAG